MARKNDGQEKMKTKAGPMCLRHQDELAAIFPEWTLYQEAIKLCCGPANCCAHTVPGPSTPHLYVHRSGQLSGLRSGQWLVQILTTDHSAENVLSVECLAMDGNESNSSPQGREIITKEGVKTVGDRGQGQM